MKIGQGRDWDGAEVGSKDTEKEGIQIGFVFGMGRGWRQHITI